MICWIDLETTGLNPKEHCILEIAIVITDDKLVEISRFHAVPFSATACVIGGRWPTYTHNVSDYVRKMHTDNGLWQESADSPHIGLDIMRALGTFIRKHADGCTPMPVGGSSVHLDRAFLTEWVAPFDPEMLGVLHYRNLDVSSIGELVSRVNPEMYAACEAANPPGQHRAMPDILRSISMARFYADALSPESNA